MSVSNGGYVIAPTSMASTMRARASPPGMSLHVVSGSSTMARMRAIRSTTDSGTTKASFTSVPMLWSMYTTTDSSWPDGRRTPTMTLSPSPRRWTISTVRYASRPNETDIQSATGGRGGPARSMRRRSTSSSPSSAATARIAELSGRSTSMNVPSSSSREGPVGPSCALERADPARVENCEQRGPGRATRAGGHQPGRTNIDDQVGFRVPQSNTRRGAGSPAAGFPSA